MIYFWFMTYFLQNLKHFEYTLMLNKYFLRQRLNRKKWTKIDQHTNCKDIDSESKDAQKAIKIFKKRQVLTKSTRMSK